MFPVDNYLNTIQKKETITEIEPVTAAAVGFSAATLMIIGKIVSYLRAASMFRRAIKIDPGLSKKLNSLLETGNKWRVHTFPDNSPNAFALGGHDVYITTGLMKLLTKREQEAVLLHEAFHGKDLHVWKDIAVDSSFIYLIAYIAITSAFVLTTPLALLIYLPLKKSADLAYKRVAGRRQELKADEFAVKLGYGDDLILALKKIEGWLTKAKSKHYCDKFCQLQRSISDALDEHPSTQKRIEVILKKSKELDRAMKGNFKALTKFVVGVFKNNG